MIDGSSKSPKRWILALVGWVEALRSTIDLAVGWVAAIAETQHPHLV